MKFIPFPKQDMRAMCDALSSKLEVGRQLMNLEPVVMIPVK
jgi:hypothetical protein